MRTTTLIIRVLLLFLAMTFTTTLVAHAQQATDAPAATEAPVLDQAPEAAPEPTIDSGNTAWMMTSSALVLMMAIPGLALFYAGMVRKKNVLSVLMQVFATVCVLALVWMIVGYSLAFSDGGAYVGD